MDEECPFQLVEKTACPVECVKVCEKPRPKERCNPWKFFCPYGILPINLFWYLVLGAAGLIVLISMFAIYNSYIMVQINNNKPIPVVPPDKLLIHATMIGNVPMTSTELPLLFAGIENNYSRVNNVLGVPMTNTATQSIITSPITGVYEVALTFSAEIFMPTTVSFPDFIVRAYDSGRPAAIIMYYGRIVEAQAAAPGLVSFTFNTYYYITVNAGQTLRFTIYCNDTNANIGTFVISGGEASGLRKRTELFVTYYGDFPPDTPFP